MTLAEKQQRVLKLYDLRRKISDEIQELEATIAREEREMKRARTQARTGIPTPTEDMREAHAAYNRGVRTDEVIEQERAYQNLMKKQARAMRREAAA